MANEMYGEVQDLQLIFFYQVGILVLSHRTLKHLDFFIYSDIGPTVDE